MVEAGIDTGSIVASSQYTFPEWCSKPIDYQTIATEQSWLLLRAFIRGVEAGNDFDLVPQQNDLSTYWPRLHADTHGFIRWDWNLDDIVRFICAFDEPYKGASTRINGNKVFLKECFADRINGPFHPFQTGLIYQKGADRLFVATRDGSLVVGHVTDQEGSSILHKLQAGQRFYSLSKDLDRALEFRAVYRPEALADR